MLSAGVQKVSTTGGRKNQLTINQGMFRCPPWMRMKICPKINCPPLFFLYVGGGRIKVTIKLHVNLTGRSVWNVTKQKYNFPTTTTSTAKWKEKWKVMSRNPSPVAVPWVSGNLTNKPFWGSTHSARCDKCYGMIPATLSHPFAICRIFCKGIRFGFFFYLTCDKKKRSTQDKELNSPEKGKKTKSGPHKRHTHLNCRDSGADQRKKGKSVIVERFFLLYFDRICFFVSVCVWNIYKPTERKRFVVAGSSRGMFRLEEFIPSSGSTWKRFSGRVCVKCRWMKMIQEIGI